MIALNARFKWNAGKGPAQVKNQKIIAHAALDAQIIKDTTPFVPMVTGMLASSPIRNKVVGVITYDTPYARRLFYGITFNFTKTFHPAAGPQWTERSKSLWMKKWTELVIKLLITGRA